MTKTQIVERTDERPLVGTEPRPLVVSATAAWSIVCGRWYVDVETMTRDEGSTRRIGERNITTHIACRSEAQARKIAAILSDATCDDGPEPADQDDEATGCTVQTITCAAECGYSTDVETTSDTNPVVCPRCGGELIDDATCDAILAALNSK